MVVILIISILVALGNYGDFSQRREKARLEELAVQLTALIDQEKTNTLLGKTESNAIVRKRKVAISSTAGTDGINELSFKSYADLAEDPEDSYCSFSSSNCDPGPPILNSWNNTPITTKSWKFYDPTLVTTIHNCDTDSPIPSPIQIVMQGDTMIFQDSSNNPITANHIILHLSRLTDYREIHIDKRTGLTFERESSDPAPSCN